MARDAPPEQRLTDAFSTFEATLQELLAAEARRSVDETLKRLSVSAEGFNVSGVEVDVTVRGLTVASQTSGGSAPARPSARRAARKPARAPGRRSGRPAGALRTALLETFAGGDEFSTDDIRQRIDTLGVQTSADNLHQQLRRLVTAGEIDRVGRGRYRRTAP